MSFASKYAHKEPLFTSTVSNPTYTNLQQLYADYGSSAVIPIRAIYINNKGCYGPQAALAISENCIVNLPHHLLSVCMEMMNDPEAVEAINSGHAGFKVYQYTTKSGRKGFSVDWVDAE